MDRAVWSVRNLVLITVALQMVASTVAAPPADLIPSLPGQPTVDFKQYSGYINIDPLHGKHMFYYFVEAANSSLAKPLVLWLNGGPGCSSLGGAFSELGPFNTNATGDGLVVNNGSWNQVANIIFLESPVGVGFSYSNTTSDYNTNDAKTAADTLDFLLGWLKEYPAYNSTDFYITGESYAGHYVPQLAAVILKSNNVSGHPQIRLKGIMVGNPLFDYFIDLNLARFEYSHGHGMLSEAAYNAVLTECNNFSSFNLSTACFLAEQTAYHQMGLDSPYLNPYDVLADVCEQNNVQAIRMQEMLTGTQFTADPCISEEMYNYLNLKEVESALHTEVSGWTQCGITVNYNRSDITIKIAPILVDLLKSNLRVWVYSGDVDLVVPFVGTRRIVSGIAGAMQLNVTSTYQPWYQGAQIGGWSVSWGSLVFATVRGAGHMVPQIEPERALQLFTSFLAGDKSPPVVP